MRGICTAERCANTTSILTYDGKDEPLCFDHYLEKVEQQKLDGQGLYKEEDVE